MSENCKSLVLQYKCNIEIFLAPGLHFASLNSVQACLRVYLQVQSGNVRYIILQSLRVDTFVK